MQLVLASSSAYRKELLCKIGLSFECVSPNIDERAQASEPPAALVERLATAKAQKISQSHRDHLIIGSDQVAVLDGQIITKPHEHQTAVDQLARSAGRAVTYLTGLCLLNSQTGRMQSVVEPFIVHFRDLTTSQIESYLQKEQPYDCTGNMKSEGLGIALITKLEGDDPNALIGLPIIRLIDMLANEGIDPLTQHSK